MYCTECGIRNADSARFCFACGTALAGSGTASTPSSAPPIVVDATSDRSQAARASSQPTSPAVKALAVGLIGGLFIMIGFALAEGDSFLVSFLPLLLFIAVVSPIVGATARILRRIGYSGWYALLWFVPLLNIVFLLVLALKGSWPIERDRHDLREAVRALGGQVKTPPLAK